MAGTSQDSLRVPADLPLLGQIIKNSHLIGRKLPIEQLGLFELLYPLLLHRLWYHCAPFLKTPSQQDLKQKNVCTLYLDCCKVSLLGEITLMHWVRNKTGRSGLSNETA